MEFKTISLKNITIGDCKSLVEILVTSKSEQKSLYEFTLTMFINHRFISAN